MAKIFLKNKGGKYNCKFAISEDGIRIERTFEGKKEEYIFSQRKNLLKKIN